MSRRDYIIKLIAGHINQNRIISERMANDILDTLVSEGIATVGYGDKDVQAITECFKSVFNTSKVSQSDRWAATRLANTYTAQAVCGIIKLLGQHSSEKFAPVVNNVTELENKFVSIMSFLRNLKQSERDTISV